VCGRTLRTRRAITWGYTFRSEGSRLQIQTTDEVEGVPLPKIRALFLQAGLDGTISRELVRLKLKLSRSKTDRLIAALCDLGFLTPPRIGPKVKVTEGLWRLTKQGIRLRGATAAKPLRRTTADRLLSELLERIAALNSNDGFLARVQKAVVFGSYVGNADRIGDVDVAVELVTREPDVFRHREANQRRVVEEFQKGRRFSTFIDQLDWWQQEAILFLRNRKRGISLQYYSAIRKVVDASPHKVVFEDRSPATARPQTPISEQKP
jgi:hypothetical protein